ncbi:uncharacterized protein LOC111289479 [Durio zibethinus]|uniref:Uncharacterized protein LOC111289479 n=1 Tax=Durio zibethinus TaxID=66656 RepID=A0A6P5Y776_DURZI|nr:uncharacterized protein LOC111289479 [Durio zibethinus]
MDEDRREEIMPVKLAIQRELAYRQKIAMLNNQSANGSGLQLMPFHFCLWPVHSGLGVSPSSTLYSSLDSHVAKKNQEDTFFCKVCRVSSSSAISYKQHLRGHKHKANLRIMPFKGK